MIDNREYSLQSEVLIEKSSNHLRIKPKVEVRMHNRKTISLQGQFDNIEGQSANAYVTLSNLFREDVSITADLKKHFSPQTGNRR